MKRRPLTGVVAAALVAGCAGLAPAVPADECAGTRDPERGTRMAADALLVRPVSLVTTVAGTVVWVVSLPFHALAGNSDQAAKALIEEPGAYTFKRPLGDFGCCRGYSGLSCWGQ
jgi:hypothetical protein